LPAPLVLPEPENFVGQGVGWRWLPGKNKAPNKPTKTTQPAKRLSEAGFASETAWRAQWRKRCRTLWFQLSEATLLFNPPKPGLTDSPRPGEIFLLATTQGFSGCWVGTFRRATIFTGNRFWLNALAFIYCFFKTAITLL